MKNGNGNGKETRLNNMQRKALAEAIKVHYQTLIDQATKKRECDQEAQVENARKRLGFYLLRKRKSQLEKEQEDLEQKMVELGFDSHGNLRTEWDSKANRYLPVSSDARRLIEGDVNNAADLLTRERDQKIKGIWLADTIKEAREIIHV